MNYNMPKEHTIVGDLQYSYLRVNELQYVRVKQGMTSIRITGLDDLMVSKIKTRYLKEQEYMNEEILESNDVVEYRIEDIDDINGQKVEVQFQPIQCSNCEKIKTDGYIDYRVIVADNKEAIVRAGVCRLSRYEGLKNNNNYVEKEIRNVTLKGAQRRLTTTDNNDHNNVDYIAVDGMMKSEFRLENRGGKYYVQIIGIVRNTTNKNDRTIMYPMKEIVNSIEQQNKRWYFKMGLAVAAIMGLAVMIWMIRARNVLLQKKIRYEMSDVRNIAAIRGDQTFEMSQTVQIKGLDTYEDQRL